MKTTIILTLSLFIICLNSKADDTIKQKERTIYIGIVNKVPDNFDYPLIGFINIADGKFDGLSMGFLNMHKDNFSGAQFGYKWNKISVQAGPSCNTQYKEDRATAENPTYTLYKHQINDKHKIYEGLQASLRYRF